VFVAGSTETAVQEGHLLQLEDQVLLRAAETQPQAATAASELFNLRQKIEAAELEVARVRGEQTATERELAAVREQLVDTRVTFEATQAADAATFMERVEDANERRAMAEAKVAEAERETAASAVAAAS
ncbi:unnamed protein product, partial [Sphacelaria rigidula]